MDRKWIEWIWRVDVESGCGEWKVDLKSGAVPDLTPKRAICDFQTGAGRWATIDEERVL